MKNSGRRDSTTAYLDVSTTDTIFKVVAEFARRDRRTVQRCLSDKLRLLRTEDIYKLRVKIYYQSMGSLDPCVREEYLVLILFSI